MFPKIVWTYWDGPRNEFTEKCIASWHKELKGWTIHVLDKESVKKYPITKPSNFEKLSRTKQSDFIRLSLLYNYGGIWLDTCVKLNESLDWLVARKGDHPYFGYVIQDSILENWLIASDRHCESIGKWRDEFVKVVESRPAQQCFRYWGAAFYTLKDTSYFDAHDSYCRLMKRDSQFRSVHESIPFMKIKSVLGEPYWNVFSYSEGKIVKFTKVHRKIFPYIKFPLLYCYILLAVLLVLLIYLSVKSS